MKIEILKRKKNPGCHLAGKSETAPRIFFSLYYFNFDFLNNETIERHARAFLTLIILAIGTVPPNIRHHYLMDAPYVISTSNKNSDRKRL